MFLYLSLSLPLSLFKKSLAQSAGEKSANRELRNDGILGEEGELLQRPPSIDRSKAWPKDCPTERGWEHCSADNRQADSRQANKPTSRQAAKSASRQSDKPEEKGPKIKIRNRARELPEQQANKPTGWHAQGARNKSKEKATRLSWKA